MPACSRRFGASGRCRREQLTNPIDFRGIITLPAVTFLMIGLKHSIHHRGQLSMYLRPMGAKVPSIYGESYDSAQARKENAMRRWGPVAWLAATAAISACSTPEPSSPPATTPAATAAAPASAGNGGRIVGRVHRAEAAVVVLEPKGRARLRRRARSR